MVDWDYHGVFRSILQYPVQRWVSGDVDAKTVE